MFSDYDDSLFQDYYSSEDDADNVLFGQDFDCGREKKSFEVEYNIKDTVSLVEKQAQYIDLIASVLGIQKRHATSLLWYFRWNTETLFEEYMKEPDKTLWSAGIRLVEKESLIQTKREAVSQSKEFECKICFEDDPDMITVGVGCGHRFCIDCYKRYITVKITEGNNRAINCPYEKCMSIVDIENIKALVPNTVYEKHRRYLNQMFVQDQASMRWCPAIDCEYAVECNIPSTSLLSVVPTVKCLCGFDFCFGCGLADHQPAMCTLVKKWMMQCTQDLNTMKWLNEYTKECPNCETPIEKNGGCNHMTCKKCRYEFCWVCIGSWSKHTRNAYNCHQYQTKDDNINGRARRNMKRYLHYYNRFINHDASARLDKNLYKKTSKDMDILQNESLLTWVQVQILKDAVDVVVKSRSTLKWTYVLAFYMKKTNQLDLFEDNQRDLEIATEQLSELLENPIEFSDALQSRQLILDKYVYVKQRREILLEYISREILEENLDFTVDLRQ
ncbi:RING finger protein [Phycomyces nitens]|nr:RING finger protein [Phycomyces nitens]